jgi:hypothetical protein
VIFCFSNLRKNRWRALPVLAILLAVVIAVLVVPRLAEAQWQVPDKTRPAYEVYKNLKLFHDDRVSVAWLERTMNNLNKYLGVECTHCHEQDNWAKDDLSEEQVHAREMLPKMWDLSGWANTDLFNPEDLKGPACWTCHRGSTKPAINPPKGWGSILPDNPEPSPFVEDDRPAREVYKNLKIFGHRPANRIGMFMRVMSAALGVGCEHCHVKSDWASDQKKAKRIARKMDGFMVSISDKYFEGKGGPTCWTCHRGSTEPEIRPAN